MPLRFANLVRVTDPSVEPVTVAELKAQLRVLHADDDTDIATLGVVAREWAEDFTSMSLNYSTWLAQYESWPAIGSPVLVVPRPPLSVVDMITYRDVDDELVELSEGDDFIVDEISGTIKFMDGFGFPTLSKDRVNPIEVTFVAGFGDAAEDVPKRFKQAIRLCVASMYGKDRGNDRMQVSFRAPSVAERLLATLRNRPI